MVQARSRVGSAFGHYEIRGQLGRGGMGEVYEAYDTVKDRTVALKILSDQHSGDETFRERFRRESHAAAKLEEPHVVPIHDWGEIDGTLYIDMRRINGVDLRTLLKSGPVAPSRAVSIIGQIAAALDAAHAAGLIHRDIKPENILITPADFAYLVDFGIAEAAGETHLTMAGTAVGSLAYMAPERFGVDPVTPAVDVYSLACVLHELLVGTTPYPSTSLQQLVVAHSSAPPPRPSLINPAVPAAFDEVIARGMAKIPNQRYPSAGALANGAQWALHAGPHHPGQASPPPAELPTTVLTPPTAAAPRANWMLPAVIAAAVVVLTAVLGLTVLLASRSPEPAGKSLSAPTIAAGVPPPRTAPIRTQPPAAARVVLPPGARVCPPLSGPVGAYATSAAGTDVTSCEFAESVREAYGRSGPPGAKPRMVNAYSPVTRKWYAMTCSAGGAMATCTGGNDAVVYAY